MNKDELTEPFGADEDAVQSVRHGWRHLWQRFDPDGTRFDPTPDRVMDGVADGIVAMMSTGGAQAQQVGEMVELRP